MSLRDIIGAAHGGGTPDWSFVSKFLRTAHLENKAEKRRVALAKKRDDLYDGGGGQYIETLIEEAFKDPETRRLRKAMIPWAKYNNVLRRVSHELATVYNEPARRRLTGDDAAYRDVIDLVMQDEAMRELDRKLVYHEDVWVQYRVRAGDRRPVLDVVSPAKFWAVADPKDPTLLIAIMLDQSPTDAPKTAPHYRVWCADETFQLDGNGNFITSSWQENPLGRLPGVLASTRPPTFKGRLIADEPAADLVAAHEAVWFLNVLLVKETKSANNQTYVTGDTSAASMGQSADTEREAILPEGVTIQSVDRGMNLDQFIQTAMHIIETAAANHGLPPSVLHQRDASSGSEIHLRRIPIRELRKQRIPIMRRIERDLASIEAAVNDLDLPALAFSLDGWGIDFGEVQQPLTESEADAVFEQRRRLGLTDTIEELRRRNPDLRTDDEALDVLLTHVEREQQRLTAMRALMAMSGAMGTPNDEATQNMQAEQLAASDAADA